MNTQNARPCLATPDAGHPSAEVGPDKGFGILEWGGVALGIIVVLAIVLVGLRTLSSRTDIGTELTNIQTIIASTRGIMRSGGGYGNGTNMTPTLIAAGGFPRSMSIDTKNNTVNNTWGGAVTVKGTGTNTFAVSYPSVPQEACITIAAQIARGGLVSSISGKSVVGMTAETARTGLCTKTGEGANANTLTFTVTG